MKTQIQNAQIWRRNLLGTLLALGCLPSGAYGQLSGGFGTTSGTLPGVAPPGSTQSEPIPGSGGLIGGPNTGASSPGFGSPSSEVGSAGSAPGGMAPGGMMGGGMGVPGGGMGGMGGSMFGTGGIGSIGSMGHMGTYSPPPTPLVIWEKPTGEKPQWLVSGHNALQATEAVRRSLEIANECAFEAQTCLEYIRIANIRICRRCMNAFYLRAQSQCLFGGWREQNRGGCIFNNGRAQERPR